MRAGPLRIRVFPRRVAASRADRPANGTAAAPAGLRGSAGPRPAGPAGRRPGRTGRVAEVDDGGFDEASVTAALARFSRFLRG